MKIGALKMPIFWKYPRLLLLRYLQETNPFHIKWLLLIGIIFNCSFDEVSFVIFYKCASHFYHTYYLF